MRLLKLTLVTALTITLTACQLSRLNPFAEKKTKAVASEQVINQIEPKEDVSPTASLAEIEQDKKPSIDWGNSVSYLQWKNAQEGIPAGYNSLQEYQEYLQWLEFQRLKNKKP